MTWPLVKMIFALGFVCVVLFGAARLLKRSGFVQRGLPFEGGIKLLTTQLIAPRKHISLVEIAGEIVALGISESQITLLTKIENREFIEKLKMGSSTSRSESNSLFQYFQRSPLKQKGMILELLRRLYDK